MVELSRQVKEFTQQKVLPGRPIMLGVDHSATGGVVSALSEALGPENLAVLVLDQHFDGLPLSLRLNSAFGRPSSRATPFPNDQDDHVYCCGNFWSHLIENKTVLPQNLSFIGVADYPEEKASPKWKRFRESYLEFESRGCHFFPLKAFKGAYIDSLRQFIEKEIKAPHLYVSLDLDVGAYRCVHAARYMDRMGIDRDALMNVARITAEHCRSGRFRLAGMDVMEFNMHFLGLETKEGMKDETASVALDFIKELMDFEKHPGR
jgi:arginase family enzyme